jgi:hypothetical protein
VANDDLTLFDDVPGTGHPETGKRYPGAALGMSDPETGIIDPGAPLSCPPGHMEPRNGHSSPRAADGDLHWAFDWSVGRGVAAVNPGGMSYRYKTLQEFLRDVPRGATVVGESTFESYDVSQRQRVMDLAESRGVILLTVPARGNTRRREAAGMPEKTSQSKRIDIEDALAIQHAAASGAHLKKPAVADEAWAALREKAARRFIYLRYSGQKDEYARSLMRQLPPFMPQPIERRVALGPVENWNPVIVAAVGVAAEFVSGRADFERLTGLYAHGYPSQFRSDLMHWGWGKQPKKQLRITLRVYRRELRWLFHQLKAADNG